MNVGISVSPSAQVVPVGNDHRIAQPKLQSPLTARGFALLLFSVYLIVFPVMRETDIVAAVFASTMLVLLTLIAGLTILSGFRLRREFHLEVSAPRAIETAGGEADAIVAGREVGCLLKLSPVSVWPLFVLTAEIIFEAEKLDLPLHRITGRFDAPKFLPQPITFPHRGIWRIREMRLSFGDQFGIANLRWSLVDEALRSAFTVVPPVRHSEDLPVVTSCQRSGDLVTDVRERRGDLFDLKPYHPSDGMRRIVWKIFARRGELVARQPEASMTPEGQVVLYTLADETEDNVCGAALGYLRRLEEIGIEVFCGAEGMGDLPPARSARAAEALYVETAWAARQASELGTREVDHLVSAVGGAIGPGSSIERVIVFCSAERLATEPGALRVTAIGRHLEARGMTPLFFVCESHRGAAGRGKRSLLDRAARLFFMADDHGAPPADQASIERALAKLAGANWDVVRIKEWAC